MRNKKGFTLIELLAVIVILAVIALIATPIIMNVINDSKKGAAKDAMYGYVKAVELATTKKVSETTNAPSGTYTTKDGDLYEGNTKTIEVQFKGTKPKDNTGSVVISNGIVTNATLEFNGVTVTYDGKKVETGSDDSTPSEGGIANKTYAIGEAVYYDPTGAVTNCDASKIWTPSNTNTTCYKWYVIKNNANNVEMILDHNTTAHIEAITLDDYVLAGGTKEDYGSDGNNKYGPLTAIKQLKKDTDNWNRVETLTAADSVTKSNASKGTYTIHYDGMKARLISMDEVIKIEGISDWTSSSSSNPSITKTWLYQNLSSTNTITEPFAYWSDTVSSGTEAPTTWAIGKDETVAFIAIFAVNENTATGVRPIVRVGKV